MSFLIDVTEEDVGAIFEIAMCAKGRPSDGSFLFELAELMSSDWLRSGKMKSSGRLGRPRDR